MRTCSLVAVVLAANILEITDHEYKPEIHRHLTCIRKLMGVLFAIIYALMACLLMYQ